MPDFYPGKPVAAGRMPLKLKRFAGALFFSPMAEGKRARKNFPTLHMYLRLTPNYPCGFLEPSVAQPPLPLQEFWPLQACFSLTCLSSFLSFPWSWLCSWALKEVFSEGSRVEALTATPVPANNPANAAPASMAFVVFVIFKLSRRFELRYETPSRHSFRIVDRESRYSVSQTSSCCDFEVASNALTRCSVR